MRPGWRSMGVRPGWRWGGGVEVGGGVVVGGGVEVGVRGGGGGEGWG